MSDEAARAIDGVLKAVARGDRETAEQLLPLVYDELRKLARQRLARLSPNQTLQPTALVHEAYLRVVGKADPGWSKQAHFFAAAAKAMRNILVDRARKKSAVKHGGGRRRVDLENLDLSIEPPGRDVLPVHEALRQLEADDPRKAEFVNLRFFAGLSAEETAAALGVSLSTVEREWREIRAWLSNRLSDGIS